MIDPERATAATAPPSTLTGDFRHHAGFPTKHLRNEHDLIVYLPPGYETDAERRYPVLYLHDGQNLFDAATAFNGKEWQVDETAQRLIAHGMIEPLIIVGIHNAGAYRIDEYTPTRDESHEAGGKAEQYGLMLVQELKPFIDAEYRTRPDAPSTGLGGSSLGGLVSLYLALRHPTVFHRLAILSPSVWWDGKFILRRIRASAAKAPQRIWLSVGTAEGDGVAEAARRVRDALVKKGWESGRDLHYLEVQGGRHDEEAWAALMDPVLRYLFPVTGA